VVNCEVSKTVGKAVRLKTIREQWPFGLMTIAVIMLLLADGAWHGASRLDHVPLTRLLPAFIVVPTTAPQAPCAAVSVANSSEPPMPMPHFVLGLGTLRIAVARSRIVADDRVHSMKALLKGTGWSRHLRVRPAAGHSGVRFAVDVTQVDADAGTVFCSWLKSRHQWKSGPYPCEMAY